MMSKEKAGKTNMDGMLWKVLGGHRKGEAGEELLRWQLPLPNLPHPLPSHVLPIAVGGECRKYIYKVHKDEVVMSKEKAGGAAAGAVKMAASMPNHPQPLPSHVLPVGVGVGGEC